MAVERAAAVRRAIQALGIVAHVDEASWGDIASGLKLAKSSTSDLVKALEADSLIGRTPGGALTLGTGLRTLARGFVGGTTLLDRFVLEWDRVPSLREHTVTLQTLGGTRALCAEARVGKHILPATPRSGSRTPIWNGTSGIPLLTRLNPESVAEVLTRFQGFAGLGDAELDSILTWLTAHSSYGDDSGGPPLRGPSGSLELSWSIPTGPSRPMAAAVTVHLPPKWDVNSGTSDLSDTLRELAESLAG